MMQRADLEPALRREVEALQELLRAVHRRLYLGAVFDVRRVDETGSTNADLLELARAGAPAGIVLVADHQTAGRGRAGRTWTAPPGASLLLSILTRPPPAVAALTTMALGLAASDAVDTIAGVRPKLKWPNDLVWPGDGSTEDRKLAGILAEAHWPSPAEVAVVAGIGLNVNWPRELPADLAPIATAVNHIVGHDVERDALLDALLERFAHHYDALVADASTIVARWRATSATLGRRVRVDLGGRELVGDAVDVTDEGHLVLVVDGARHVVAVGDVVHLRVERPSL
jgi:BirA family biotin operon repressor/biotin-[acetyl-CoA-carboxylase] ligase